MKCMCSNCGEIINKGEIAFDFTEYYINAVSRVMSEDLETRGEISEGRDLLFNKWKRNHKRIETEASLMRCPKSGNTNNVKTTVIRYDLNLAQFIRSVKEDSGDFGNDEDSQEKADEFFDWYDGAADRFKGCSAELSLILDGDGDLGFNRIAGVTNKRICPHCHSVLSFWAGRYPEWTLTVLGGPRVSKSTAVTACVSGFMQGRDSVIRIEGAEDDDDFIKFKEICLDLYENIRPLKATDTVSIPRVSFRVTIGSKHICLTFIDLPGEFNSERGINAELEGRYRKIFNNIDFVWYCTNPGEIQQLTGAVVEQELGYDNAEVVMTDRIKSNMRILSSYFASSKRKIPVAYIMGKTDAVIEPEDQKKYGLFSTTDTPIKVPFDVRAFYRRSEKVRDYIRRENNELLCTFEECFPERCFIATSAYGHKPEEGGDVRNREAFKPYRCKEVFFWMLALRNCIEIKSEVTVHRIFRNDVQEDVIDFIGNLEDEQRTIAYHNLYMQGNYMS